MTDLIQLQPVERIERVVDYAFGGLHHTRGLKRHKEGNGFEWWEFTVSDGSMATEDADELTRLVIASLEYGVRAEVSGGGPYRIKVRLFPRNQRGGHLHERIRRVSDHLSVFAPAKRLEAINSQKS